MKLSLTYKIFNSKSCCLKFFALVYIRAFFSTYLAFIYLFIYLLLLFLILGEPQNFTNKRKICQVGIYSNDIRTFNRLFGRKALSKFPMMQQLGKTNLHSFGGKELIGAFAIALVLGSFRFARQKK